MLNHIGHVANSYSEHPSGGSSADRAGLDPRDQAQVRVQYAWRFCAQKWKVKWPDKSPAVAKLIVDAVIEVTCQDCSLRVGRCCLGPLAEPDRPPFKRLYARALGSTSAQEQRQAQVVRFPPLATLQKHQHARFAHVFAWSLGGAQAILHSIGSAASRERSFALVLPSCSPSP